MMASLRVQYQFHKKKGTHATVVEQPKNENLNTAFPQSDFNFSANLDCFHKLAQSFFRRQVH